MNINLQLTEKIREKITQFLEEIGFPKQEIKEQLTELGRIIIMSGAFKLLKDKGKENSKFTPEELERFVQENYSKEEIQAIFQEEVKG